MNEILSKLPDNSCAFLSAQCGPIRGLVIVGVLKEESHGRVLSRIYYMTRCQVDNVDGTEGYNSSSHCAAAVSMHARVSEAMLKACTEFNRHQKKDRDECRISLRVAALNGYGTDAFRQSCSNCAKLKMSPQQDTREDDLKLTVRGIQENFEPHEYEWIQLYS